MIVFRMPVPARCISYHGLHSSVSVPGELEVLVSLGAGAHDAARKSVSAYGQQSNFEALDVLVLSIWVVAISSFGFLVGDQ